MAKRLLILIVLALPLTWSCSDQTNLGEGDKDFGLGLFLLEDAANQDVPTISVDQPDAEVDPCLEVENPTDPGWCNCNPECCQAQLWFCPPVFGDPTVYAKEVIIDICDESNSPCVYEQDLGCQPPEIISESDCEPMYECPPAAGINYGWQLCELPNGEIGKQQVICDKGHLHYTPCQGCELETCDGLDNDCDSDVDEDLGPIECQTACGPGIGICLDGEITCFGPDPSEEICDNLDNDCDGQVDEFQLNACGQCGLVPSEQCDGVDNDCDGMIDEELVQACQTECEAGIEICSNGQWAGCTAKQPQPEICDGLDNNCNQQIDEGIECLCSLQDVGVLMPCAENPLLCGQGFKTCECIDPQCQQFTVTECAAPCYWLTDPPGIDPLCDAFVGMALEEEECNNFDDNCNQLIDEDLTAQCYSGPPNTLGVGLCEPGIMSCIAGVWGSNNPQEDFVPGLCLDETVPQPEICDGNDNDCDGLVDWGEDIPDTDILFVVDWSGSMDDEIDAVLIALNQFAANYSDQNALRWGLIIGPRDTGFAQPEELVRVSDILPFPDFLAAFAALGNDHMDGGKEMLLDGLYLAYQNISASALIDIANIDWDDNVGSDPEKDLFSLSWRPGANRVIIVFTDEEEQSFMEPEITTDDIISACQGAPNSKLYTFSTNLGWSWDEMADACSGVSFNLTNNALDMYNNLMQILDEICMPQN